MKTSLWILLGVLFFCTFISSCKKADRIKNESSFEKEEETVYNFIKKMGYKDSEIKDIGSEYLVDEDILFSKAEIPSFSIFGDGPKTKQYGTNYYVGYNNQPNIKVRIDPSMSSYTSEINGALTMWNNVANCRVKFSLISSSDQDILITNSNLGSGICGAAYFPVNGRSGGLVRININEIAGNSFDQRKRTIAHELGHTIGFRHTNWQSSGEPFSGTLPDNGAKFNAMQILGTPTGGDAVSIMNGGECGIGATAFSNYDILAVQFLYPANPPVQGTVPVFRYYFEGNSAGVKADHVFTTDINELGNGTSTHLFEGIGFFAFPTQVTGSAPVYRYYSYDYNDHYYTTVFKNYGTWNFEKIAFYAYPSSINGALPVYGYYSAGQIDHHYTKNPNETPMPGYVYELTAFYAY